MPRVLTTKTAVAVLDEIIRKADKEIFLFSFSFIISDSFITRLKQASGKGKKINIIYGKSIREDSLLQLHKIPNLRIYHYPNLHAKVFANETKCVIGSMNFSEASEINNMELGVLLTSEADSHAFIEALEHCKDIHETAVLVWPKNRTNNLIKPISEKVKVNPLMVKSPKNKKSEEETIEEDINYFREGNFFYPELYKQMTRCFKGYWIGIDKDCLELKNYPINGIDFELNNVTLDIKFRNVKLYSELKSEKMGTILKKNNFFRIFWNYNVINIYLPSKYERRITKSELKKLTNEYLYIVSLIGAEINNLIKK